MSSFPTPNGIPDGTDASIDPDWYWPGVQATDAQAGATNAASVLRRALDARRLYAHGRGWWLGLLSRAMLKASARGLWVPGRGAVRRVRLADSPRSFALRLGTTDWYSLEDARVHGVYDAALKYLQAARLEAEAIIDLGANIGLSVDLWQERFPRAPIVALEPDADNARIGRLNTRRGSRYAPVRWVEAAIAEQDGWAELDLSPGEWTARTRAIGAGPKTSNRVRAVSVASLLEECGIQGPIGLFKCVVMGAEAQVFPACAPWIDRVEVLIVHLYRDSYSSPRLMQDLEHNSSRQSRLKIFHHVRYRQESELLCLARQAP